MKPDQVAVDDDHCFVGFDAYQKVLAQRHRRGAHRRRLHFHPRILEAAVDAGKHVFCEKPHSLDVPGLKRVKAICEEAEEEEPEPSSRALLALQPRSCARPSSACTTARSAISSPSRRPTACGPTTSSTAQSEVDRDGVADAQLVPLQLAGRRPVLQQLIHSIDKGGLGHARRAAGEGLGHGRPRRLLRPSSTATCSTTRRSSSSTPTACGCTACAATTSAATTNCPT